MGFPLEANLRSSGLAANCPRITLRLFIAGLVLVLFSGIFTMCPRTAPGFVQNYSATVYPVLMNTPGYFGRLFPFSLSEAGLYLTAVFCVINIVLLFKRPLCSLAHVFFYAYLLLFLLTVDCGISYHRSPFPYETSMVMEQSSTEEPYSLCLFLTNQVNSSLGEVDRSTNFLSDLYPGQTENTPLPAMSALREMDLEGITVMNSLGAFYAQLDEYYLYPKSLMSPGLLSIQRPCGIYSPFAIEVNYNREMPYCNIPHTICHKLSHLKGFMREDEVNFIDHLAYIGSQSSDFRYGGYLTGQVYAGSTLAKVGLGAYYGLYSMLSPKAAQDLKRNDRFWDQYDGKVAEVSTQLNDHYLKTYSQEDSVRSYGRTMGLTLMCHREALEGEKIDPDLHSQGFYEPN